jgi:hypothetical protein
MLENLGWSFHRIWSTDWFFRRSEEIERVWNAYQLAIRKADEYDSPHESPAPDGDEEVLYDDGVVQKPRRSSPLPPITMRKSIEEYTPRELKKLHEWVLSDGVLRTHDEIADEMFRALPFNRRGARIEAALRQTIASGDKGTGRERQR